MLDRLFFILDDTMRMFNTVVALAIPFIPRALVQMSRTAISRCDRTGRRGNAECPHRRAFCHVRISKYWMLALGVVKKGERERLSFYAQRYSHFQARNRLSAGIKAQRLRRFS